MADTGMRPLRHRCFQEGQSNQPAAMEAQCDPCLCQAVWAPPPWSTSSPKAVAKTCRTHTTAAFASATSSPFGVCSGGGEQAPSCSHSPPCSPRSLQPLVPRVTGRHSSGQEYPAPPPSPKGSGAECRPLELPTAHTPWHVNRLSWYVWPQNLERHGTCLRPRLETPAGCVERGQPAADAKTPQPPWREPSLGRRGVNVEGRRKPVKAPSAGDAAAGPAVVPGVRQGPGQ